MSPKELEQIIHHVIELGETLYGKSTRSPQDQDEDDDSHVSSESDGSPQDQGYPGGMPKEIWEPRKPDALDDYLDSLDLEALATLHAVMYCGRDGSLDVLSVRARGAPYERASVIRTLGEKRMRLAEYLRQGLDSVGRQFPKLLAQPLPDKPPDKPSKAWTLASQDHNGPTQLPEQRRPTQRPASGKPPEIAGYTFEDLLGKGGNGEVWECKDRSGSTVALKKFTKSSDPKRLDRFRNEVEVLRKLTTDQIAGVVPLLEHQLDRAPYFYVMPRGKSATSYFKGGLVKRMEWLSQLASTLVLLHDKKIFHKDIKPENILNIEGVWCFADFGLAKFPDARQVTEVGERVGPYFNMPPEMRRAAKDAEGGPADVYMFAKTAWMLLTGDWTGFDGQFDSSIHHLSLRRRFPHDPMAAIEHAIRLATAYNPKERPTMRELAHVFQEWLSVKDNFAARMIIEWKYSLKQIFPARIPHRAEWTDRDSIVDVLQVICQTSALNHGFLPGGGGLDLKDVKSLGSDQIRLRFINRYHEAKPLRLELVWWPQKVEWSYFFLELAPLEPTVGSLISSDGFDETFVKFPDGQIKHPIIFVPEGEYIGDEFVPLTRSYKLKERLLKGSLVFFSKASTYNLTPSTYDARHQKMGRERFYQHIRLQVLSKT